MMAKRGTASLRPGGRVRRLLRRLVGRRVPAGVYRGPGPGWDDGGGAGVREPRRPLPKAPAGAAERVPSGD
jgi:hypothetical protein